MKKISWIAVNLAIVMTMGLSTAMAGPDDCSIGGGGTLDDIYAATDSCGTGVRFGGSISASCQDSTTDVKGNWVFNFSDGSRFATTEIDSLTFFFAGAVFANITGRGNFEGGNYVFHMLVESYDNPDGTQDQRLTIELYTADNNVRYRSEGWLTGGSINIVSG